MLFLLSRSRRILKEGRVKRLLPTVPKWTNNEQESRPIYRSTICRLSTDISNGCFLTIDQVSTDHRPSVDQCTDRYIDQVSTNYRRSVGEVSLNEKLCRPRYIWNDYRATIDRVSTECRPTIDRYIDRVSTDYRPLYRPLDRSTLPMVNMIQII